MTTLARLVTIAAICLVAVTAAAQGQQADDVLYLKNGSIIRGSILEAVPSGNVRIRTSDGSVFVYRFDEVDRIEKSPMVPVQFRRQSNSVKMHRQIAGAGLLTSYLVTVVAAAAMNDETISTTAIPVVGPFATMGRVDRSSNLYFAGKNRGLLITSGIVQTGFLVYLTAALVADGSPSQRFVVRPTPNAKGLALRYRF